MRSWMGLEVGLLELLAGEMRVELSRGEISVAEHLLDRAQVASSGQEVRRERVPEGVRAHPVAEAGGLGVAQHDLVEALAGQRSAPEVEEELALLRCMHQLGPPRAQVDPHGRDRLAADRNEPLLRSLSGGPDDAVLEIDVRYL